MSWESLQTSAQMHRAELVGHRLADCVDAETEQDFSSAAPEGRVAASYEELFADMAKLDITKHEDVAAFLCAHFAEDMHGMSEKQRAAAAEAFASHF